MELIIQTITMIGVVVLTTTLLIHELSVKKFKEELNKNIKDLLKELRK